MSPTPELSTVEKKPRLSGFDGLRGLAAMAVFGVHYNQIVDVDVQLGPFDLSMLLINGEYGVALFFILSGLLLSQPFWKSILYQAHWPDLKIYALHRIARIVPAYYIALTLLIILTNYWQYPESWVDILLHYSFLFNYAEFSIFSINPPFWTLAVEMQFYCLLPLLFLLVRRLPPLYIYALLILFSVTSYGLHYALTTSLDKFIYWPGSTTLMWIRPYGAVVTHTLLAHLPHFLTGVFCGALLLCLQTSNTRISIRYEIIFWASFSFIVLALATDIGDLIQIPFGRYGLPLVPLLLGAMLLTTPFTRGARRLLDSQPIHILGTLSYGIYIYHLPVLSYVDRTMMELSMDAAVHWGYLGAVSLTLTLLVASISYVLIERPALRLVRYKCKN